MALVKSPITDGGGGVGKQLDIDWGRNQVVVKEVYAISLFEKGYP